MNVKSRRPGPQATRQNEMAPTFADANRKEEERWLVVRVVGVEPYLITIKSRVPDR